MAELKFYKCSRESFQKLMSKDSDTFYVIDNKDNNKTNNNEEGSGI